MRPQKTAFAAQTRIVEPVARAPSSVAGSAKTCVVRFSLRRRRLPAISEAEAYDRSYGFRSADVQLVRRTIPLPRPRPRYDVLRRGESIRRAFSDRLAARARHDSE